MINGIKPNPMVGDFDKAMDRLVENICKEKIEGFGHNAQPINDGICCDDCNNLVLVERIDDIINKGDVK